MCVWSTELGADVVFWSSMPCQGAFFLVFLGSLLTAVLFSQSIPPLPLSQIICALSISGITGISHSGPQRQVLRQGLMCIHGAFYLLSLCHWWNWSGTQCLCHLKLQDQGSTVHYGCDGMLVFSSSDEWVFWWRDYCLGGLSLSASPAFYVL